MKERKRLEEELRNTRLMLEETQRIAQIGSWELDLASGALRWTDEISRIFEIAQSPAGASHDVFLRRVHREDRDRVAAAYADSVKHGSSQLIDYRLHFPDGRIKDVRERRETRLDVDDKPLSVFGTVQDITEVKLAEAMLENEKSRLQTFLNTIPDLVWIKDTEGFFLACNPVFEKFFGAKEEEIVGKTDFDFVDADLAAFFRQKDREAMVAGRPIVNEEWATYVHSGGQRALLETIKTPLYDDQGHIAGVLGIARDITERKQMEESLHLREQAFRTIAENSTDRIARYDRECRCLYVNPALQKLIGAPATAFLGKTPLETVYNFDGLKVYEEKIREALRTGQETELELISDSSASLMRPICDHIRFTPEFDRDGQVISVLAVGRDIARLKETEHHLAHSRALLQNLVARQEQEREAERKRIAWEVHEELGQLLTALRIHFTLMHGRLDDGSPMLQEQYRSTMEMFDRSVRVVRNVTSALRPRVLDLGIDSALEWLAEKFMKHAAVFCEVSCGENIVMDEDHATVLFRVAEEALDNIARHAQANAVEIVLERRQDDYVLVVRDDGKGFDPGMPKEKKLGLLQVQERVRTVDGTVEICSSPGGGTTIEVCIPVPLAIPHHSI